MHKIIGNTFLVIAGLCVGIFGTLSFNRPEENLEQYTRHLKDRDIFIIAHQKTLTNPSGSLIPWRSHILGDENVTLLREKHLYEALTRDIKYLIAAYHARASMRQFYQEFPVEKMRQPKPKKPEEPAKIIEA